MADCHNHEVSDLLAGIVASRRLQFEPVATDALVHVLSRSSAGRAALKDLLVALCPTAVTTGLTVVGQMTVEEDAGRPDVVGQDATGVRIVIEAKFDAELTAAQTRIRE